MNARERLLASLAPDLVDALEQLVEERVSVLRNVAGPVWLSIAEAADYCSVSQRTIARWLSNKRLRSSTLGRRVLISRNDLDSLLCGDGQEGGANRPTARRRRAQSSQQRPEN